MSEIKQINTGVAELLAVKVPEGAHEFTIMPLSSILFYSLPHNDDLNHIKLPKLKYGILGIDTELTEEQCRGVVKFGNDYFEPGYLNYMLPIGSVNRFRYNTAKDAFASLMQANGCYSANPLGEKPKPFSYVKWQVQARAEAEWQQAEANTGTWLILKRLS